IQNDQSMYQGCYPYCSTLTLNNTGTIRKTAGSGITGMGAIFNNMGTVQTLTGTLRLDAGGWGTGGFDTAAGAVLCFAGGTYHFQPGIHFSGAGANLGAGATIATTATVN